MNRSIIFTGLIWGSSLMAAGWLGRTYFADSAGQNAASARPGPTTVVSGNAAANPAGSEPGTPGAAAQPTASTSKSFFADSTKSYDERVKAWAELDDPTEKMTAYLEMLGTLQTNEEFQAAAKSMAEHFDPRGRGKELSMLMTEWAKRDPLAALEMTSKNKDWQGRYGATAVLQTWVKADPAAAKAWAMEHGKELNKDDGNWYMVGVINGLAKQDLATAAAWAQEQPRSRARGDMMDKVLDSFVKQRGNTAALEWVNGIEAGPFKDGAARRLADRISEKDPTMAANWVATLPNGETKSGAMSELLDNWANRDPNAAATWLKNYQPSPETDEPRQTFAWSIRERDPESALAWAGTISDTKRRDRAMVDLVKDWKNRDSKGAQAYMLTHHWPEQTIKKVLN